MVVKETWLSRTPRRGALDLTFGIVGALVLVTFLYLNGAGGGERLLAASGTAVFAKHEYWRIFTTLFAHADLGHLLSNLLLFVPFSYFLAGYTPRWFYPFAAFASMGLANLLVLRTMEPAATLVGASGVVYWMGGAWITLYLRIEKRERLRTRWGKAVIVTAATFLPETVQPQVSYFSHYLGFALGVASALLLYALKKKEYQAAERREFLLLPDVIEESEWNTPPEARSESSM